MSEGEVEPAKKGLYFGGERQDIPKAEHTWLLLCFNLKSGRQLWRQEAHRRTPKYTLHVKNTYASATPVTDGERVYAYFANVGLYCYDMEGQKLWSTHWPPVKTRNGWGAAASPVLCDGRVFLVNDNDEALSPSPSMRRPAASSGGSSATKRATGPRLTSGATTGEPN